MGRYIDVALNVPLNQTFTYSEPESEEAEKQLDTFGYRVSVPFGNRKMSGIVVGVHNTLPESCATYKDKIRAALKYLDKTALLTQELYQMALWLSAYYLSPIGEVVSCMIPSGKKETGASSFSLLQDETEFEQKTLSEEQQKAVKEILGETKRFYHYLYGMTGSGKTEVFLSVAEEILNRGKGVIYLVPEIGLTPQVIKSVVKRFGNTVAVLHSELTPNQKLGEWNRILKKEARIVIGARSAIFAPIPDLGLIIIDEEHDSSYKAGSSPRYHARQVAMYRALKQKIPLLMGSATPSVEAWHSMQTGLIVRHTLTKRLAGGALPRITCVNLSLTPSSSCISAELSLRIKDALRAKRQVILFLNRRGFTHFFRCKTCGFELKCKNCSVSLTYHKKENRLRCHYCGYIVQPPQTCPQCDSVDVGYFGFGTEYIEAEVAAKFPAVRMLRIDTDSLTHKGELQEKLDAFRAGNYDILLGTQMVAKGLNFPAVKLVGVILADTSLHLPDFRASEKAFSLITQVSGRAGRFFPDGEVVVQSYDPTRKPIKDAVEGLINDFYADELQNRSMLGFPPFSRLLRFVFRSAMQKKAEKAAENAYEVLRLCREPQVDILGPSECPLEMVSGNYRYQIILRGNTVHPLQKMAATLLVHPAPSHVYTEVDVDPVNLL